MTPITREGLAYHRNFRSTGASDFEIQRRSAAASAFPWALIGALLILVVGCHSTDVASTGTPATPATELDQGILEREDRHEFTSVHMAIPFRIVLYAPNSEGATAAANAAFNRIEELNSHLSDYLPESELSRLSRTAGSNQWIPLGPDLAQVLVRGLEISRVTEGAFDPTLGSCIQLWRRSRRQGTLPTPERLNAARESFGWNHLDLDPTGPDSWSARLNLEGMRLDLGGIAKGFALDEAARVLRQHGYPSHLVAGAGDILAGTPPPGKRAWHIDVPLPDTLRTNEVRTIHLVQAALCTSGDLFQYVEIDGIRYSHIVDPKTGLGRTEQRQVTVIAPSGMVADALSTACSVLDPDQALHAVKLYDAELWLTRETAEGIETVESGGFKDP